MSPFCHLSDAPGIPPHRKKIYENNIAWDTCMRWWTFVFWWSAIVCNSRGFPPPLLMGHQNCSSHSNFKCISTDWVVHWRKKLGRRTTIKWGRLSWTMRQQCACNTGKVAIFSRLTWRCILLTCLDRPRNRKNVSWKKSKLWHRWLYRIIWISFDSLRNQRNDNRHKNITSRKRNKKKKQRN